MCSVQTLANALSCIPTASTHVAILGGTYYICFLNFIQNINIREGNDSCTGHAVSQCFSAGSDIDQQGTFGNVSDIFVYYPMDEGCY